MTMYEVYATRWDSPLVVSQLLPARGLQFSMPLSDHGECSFTATVEPGRSFWRDAIAPPLSGILIARDGVPVWSGWVRPERQTGPRTFSFQAREWGSFFAEVDAVAKTYSGNDHAMFRDVVDSAQAVSGQDVSVVTGSTEGATESTLTVQSWEDRTAEDVFLELANREGGPEWYFGTAGTMTAPVRQLVLGDRLGASDPVDVLQYVEDTGEWAGYDAPPTVALLSDLYHAGTSTRVPVRRAGGNVIALSRDKDPARSATVAKAAGDGVEDARPERSAVAQWLLDRGWPRLTKRRSYSTVSDESVLQRHANADLAAQAGIATRYSLVSFDGDPDWTQVPRGSAMRVSLDTDVYASTRPYVFDTRVLNMTVNVPDDGGRAQVQWDLAEVMEEG